MIVFSIDPEGICAFTITKVSIRNARMTAPMMTSTHWNSSFPIEVFLLSQPVYPVYVP